MRARGIVCRESDLLMLSLERATRRIGIVIHVFHGIKGAKVCFDKSLRYAKRLVSGWYVCVPSKSHIPFKLTVVLKTVLVPVLIAL